VSFLVLEDGSVYRGESVGAPGVAAGEAVFTTAMTGYQEIVSDPSYSEQLVAFTAPMVGNYGVAPQRMQSNRIHARAVLMRETGSSGWSDWLRANGIVALTGVDTRSLTLRLRDSGSARAVAVAGEGSVEAALALARRQPGMTGRALAGAVSTPAVFTFAEGAGARLAVLDLGVKRSLLARLAAAGASVTVFPHDTDADTLAPYDGVVLSNGPGDPEPLTAQVQTVRALLGRVPVLGICLGHQLLALATGHRTYKLPFGHRGANHPVVDRVSGRVLVTSQNHGFAVAAGEGPGVSHLSLYDGTVEGLDLPELAARSLQFHPEAGPGPHDAWPVLERWADGVVRRLAAAA